MQNNRLLEQIWGNAIELRDPDQMSPLARLLEALLTVPTVALVSYAAAERPLALMESAELLPGASLGDILAEEIGIDVPRDAVVLIEPAAFADAESFSGNALGQELGRILMELACAGAAPLIRADVIGAAGVEAARPAPRPLVRDYARIAAEVSSVQSVRAATSA